MTMCDYCKIASKPLVVIEYGDEGQAIVDIAGYLLRVFDNELPGIFVQERINFCPMCGRNLMED